MTPRTEFTSVVIRQCWIGTIATDGRHVQDATSMTGWVYRSEELERLRARYDELQLRLESPEVEHVGRAVSVAKKRLRQSVQLLQCLLLARLAKPTEEG